MSDKSLTSHHKRLRKAWGLLLGWQLKKGKSRGEEVKKGCFSCHLSNYCVVMGRVINFDEKGSLQKKLGSVVDWVMLTGSRKLILVLHTNPKSFIEAEWKSLALFLVVPFILCIYRVS